MTSNESTDGRGYVGRHRSIKVFYDIASTGSDVIDRTLYERLVRLKDEMHLQTTLNSGTMCARMKGSTI